MQFGKFNVNNTQYCYRVGITRWYITYVGPSFGFLFQRSIIDLEIRFYMFYLYLQSTYHHKFNYAFYSTSVIKGMIYLPLPSCY